MKTCTKCKTLKSEKYFGKDKNRHDGLYPQCKDCVRANTKIVYARDREKELARGKEYRKLNNEKNRERNKKYYHDNLDKEHERSKKYREKNLDREIVRKKIYRQTKKKEIAEYFVNRKKTDIAFKLLTTYRTAINKYVKQQSSKKQSKTKELLGCSSEQLKLHLESLFKEDMSWDNYGRYGWHIDHIRPCASYDLTDVEQQKACFHYSNLQPLWANENKSKGSKYNGIIYKIK